MIPTIKEMQVMKRALLPLALIAMGFAGSAAASGFNDWPVSAKFGDVKFSLTGQYNYDFNDPHNAQGVLDKSQTNRRKEFGFKVADKGKWDGIVYFDFQSKKWLDVYWRVDTKWLFGHDFGKVRFGYSKTPVGFEANTSSRTTSFMELALPETVYEGRRTGVDWALERPQYLINVGYYFGQDLQGDNDGTTVAARAAWTPFKASGEVLHLGLSGSIEHPQATTDGRDIRHDPGKSWASKPEMGLTTTDLISSGSLSHVDSNRRMGFEGLWIHGPLSLQGEYLQAHTKRNDGLPSYTADGYYAFGSYVLTGESRPYSGGNVGNIKPTHPWGAVELLLRYSALDLNDGPVLGGRQHDVTLGANWYLTQHFKLQADYVKVHADRKNGQHLDPNIVELRASVFF